MNRLSNLAWGSRPVACGVLAALLIGVTACKSDVSADNRPAAETAVKEADAQWSKVAGTRDVDATVAYYTDDASLLSPNAPIATSKQAIRAVWADLLSPDINVTWEVTKAEAAQSGDLAYVVGVYQITPNNEKGKPMADRGKLVEVWKKQADGKWKVVADIFNSDLPATAPTPEPAKKKK